jgi:predicted nuclease of predicted toxin-antitoxin system
MIYLVDVNLPLRFFSIKSISCVYVKSLSDEMPDSEIWNLALEKGYIILTRDKDFYFRAMQSLKLPKIILFRLGNCRGKEVFEYFERNLTDIEKHLNNHKLLVLWPNEIQVVI